MSNIKKTRARVNKGNDFITNVISANQGFSIRIFKFQRRSCKLSFLFSSHRQRTQESLFAGYVLVYREAAKTQRKNLIPWRPLKSKFCLKTLGRRLFFIC